MDNSVKAPQGQHDPVSVDSGGAVNGVSSHPILHVTVPPSSPKSRIALVAALVLLGILLVLGLSGFWLYTELIKPVDSATASSQSVIARYKSTTLSTRELGPLSATQSGEVADLLINGTLTVSHGIDLVPGSLPTVTDAVPGRLYYDKTTNQPYIFSGGRYLSLTTDSFKLVQSIGGQTGVLGLGAGLTMQGGVLSSTALQSLPQAITVTSTPTFAGLSLSQPLAVTSGGTGRARFTQNGLLLGNGTDALNTLVPAGANQCLVSTGTPSGVALAFNDCPSASGVASVNGLNGALTIGNATSSGNTITLNDASTTSKGIANFNSTNFTASGGVVNTIQDITTSSSPMFSGLSLLNALGLNYGGTGAATPSGARTNLGAAQNGINGDITATTVLNTITPTNTLTIGASGFGFVLQGNHTSTISATNSGNTTTLSFANPIANTILTLPALSAGTYTLCTTNGNCAGVGGSVTTPGGNSGTLARFSGANTLVDSLVSEAGSVLTVAGSGIVQGAGGTASLTIGTASANTGKLVYANGTNANTLTLQSGATTSNLTFTLPVADGAGGQCLTTNGTGVLAFSNCLSGSGVSGGVSSLNGLVGGLDLANATAIGSTITIDNASTAAKGIASFNSTNFSVTSGAVNTVQDIALSSSPTFAAATLTGTNGLMVGSGTVPGKIVIRDGNAASYGVTLNTSTLSANRTVSFRDAAGTICLEGNTNCGFAPSSGSNSYIQLGPASAQVDSSANPSIFISKTTVGNLLQLQSSGSDMLRLSTAGELDIGAGGAWFHISNTNTSVAMCTPAQTNTYLTVATNGGGCARTSSTLVRGFSVQPTNNGTGDVMGINVNPIANNAVNNIYGVYAQNRQAVANTAVNSYTYYAVSPQINASGAITNQYGMYIEAQKLSTVTNGYGIYQAGASDRNYFAGNVGIGSNAPQAKLDVRAPAIFWNGQGGGSAPAAAQARNAAEFLVTASSMVTIGEETVGNANPAITFYRTDGGLRTGTATRIMSNSGSMYFQQGTGHVDYGTETYATNLFLQAGGSVGIGTTNVGSYKLNIQGGDVKLGSGLSVDGAAVVTGDITTNSTMRVGAGFSTFSRDNLAVYPSTGSNGFTIMNTRPDAHGVLKIGAYNTEAIHIIDAGKVGIGNFSPSAQLQVQSTSAGTVAQIVQGTTGQTADIMRVLESGGNSGLIVNSVGDVYANYRLSAASSDLAATVGAKFAVGPGAGTVGQVIQGSSGQTADLFQLTASNGAMLSRFDANGQLTTNGTGVQVLGLTTPSFTTVSTGSSYYYVVTAVNGVGETVASSSLGMSNNTSALAWSAVAGATSYKIYRNTTNSFAAGSLYLASVTTGTSYIDNGSATTAGLPPATVTGSKSIVRVWQSQTGNVFEVQDNAGSALASFDGSGFLYSRVVRVGSSNMLGGQLNVVSLTGTNKAAIIRGATGQSVDLIQIQDSTGNINAAFNNTGNQLTLGRIAASGTVTQGALVLSDGTTSNYGWTLQGTGTLTANQTISLRNATGTVCLEGNANCGFAASTGASGYVQNGTSVQSANFYARSSASGSVGAIIEGANGQTADLLRINTYNGSTSTTVAKFDNVGNVTTTGTLTVSGSGTSSIAGALGIGTTNPMTTSVTLANTWWFSGIDAAGTGTINMFQPSSSNDIQVGAALNIDGGIIFPTDGGQLTMSDMAFSASGIAAGTPMSYTMRIGMTNALTVYAENDGAGNAQNVRIAIGTSIAPQYTLDVGGTIATTSDIRLGGHIITTGATPGIAAGAAACTSPTVSVAGSDTAGTITITTGTGCAAGGTLATITFAAGYGAAPRVTVSATNSSSAQLLPYANATTSALTLGVSSAPTDSTTYTYNYHAAQ